MEADVFSWYVIIWAVGSKAPARDQWQRHFCGGGLATSAVGNVGEGPAKKIFIEAEDAKGFWRGGPVLRPLPHVSEWLISVAGTHPR